MALLPTSTFVNGIRGWRPVNYAGSGTAHVVADNSAYVGGHLLRESTTRADGSVAIDVRPRPVLVTGWDSGGDDVQAEGTPIEPSLAVQAWIRAAPDSGQFTTTLALWQLPTPNRSTSSTFTVGEQWTLIGGFHEVERSPPEPGLPSPSTRITQGAGPARLDP